MRTEFTDSDKNILREFIKTDTGKKLLIRIAEQETTLLAEAFNPSASTEKQLQIVNKVSGSASVRSLIQGLADAK